jgi:hypothetical protein
MEEVLNLVDQGRAIASSQHEYDELPQNLALLFLGPSGYRFVDLPLIA